MAQRVLQVVAAAAVAAMLPVMAHALMPGGAAAIDDGDEIVRITEADCTALVRHTPGGDVAYRPGVDANGNPVASADVGGGNKLNLGSEMYINIEMELAGRYGVPANAMYQGTLPVGQITVQDGRAYFNGQPMADVDQETLALACARKGIK